MRRSVVACVTLACAVLAAVPVPGRAALPPPPGVVFAEVFTFFPGYQPVCNAGADTCETPDDTHRKLEQLELHITQGATLEFVNLDPSAFHTVTAYHEQAVDPLFDSGEPIPAGQTAPVKGTELLPPGAYRFQCELHTNLMQGRLIVDPA